MRCLFAYSTMSTRLWLIITMLLNAIALNPGFREDFNSMSSSNLTIVIPWTCWPEEPRIIPPVVEDCRKLAESIQTLRPVGRPYTTGGPIYFGTDDVPGADFLLPLSISKKTCKVRLQNFTWPNHVIESFTPRFLAHATNRMATRCLIPPPHVGGEGGIGPKEAVALVVSGFIKPLSATGLGDHLVIEQRAVHDSLEYEILLQDLAAHASASEDQ